MSVLEFFRSIFLRSTKSSPDPLVAKEGSSPKAPIALQTIDPDEPETVVQIEVNGVLDLHHFSPKDLKYLIPDYLDECCSLGIYEVRIIHGKGTGTLRRTVHSLLSRNQLVADFKLADELSGSWGATIVRLHRMRYEKAQDVRE